MLGAENFDLYETDEEPPFGLTVVDDETGRRVVVLVYDDTGIRGMIVNDCDPVVGWSEDVYDRYRTRGQRVLTRTIRVKIHSLTNVKERLLSREYAAFQRAVEGEDADLYSATKQQARKVRRQKNPRYEQPVVLRNDVIAVLEQDLPLSKWWVKVPPVVGTTPSEGTPRLQSWE